MRNSSKISKNRCSHRGTKTLVIASALLITSLTGCRKTETDTGQHPTSKEVVVCTMSTTPIVPTTATTTTTQNMTTSTKVTTSKSTTEVVYRNTTKTKPSVIIYNATQLGVATNTPAVKTTKIEIATTEPVTTECVTTIPIEEYVVYKPSTYYIHRNTCHWNSDDAYKISDTNGIEARRCSECNPDIEIVNEYIPPVVENSINSSCWDVCGLTIREGDKTFVSICNVVDREYGSTYHGCSNSVVTDYERSQVAMTILNRYSAGYGNMEYIIYNGYDKWAPYETYSWSNNYIQRNQPYNITARAVKMALNAFTSGDNYKGIKSFYGANGYNCFY